MKTRENSLPNVSHFLYALILYGFLQGCSPGQKIDQQAVREEMASREIKKASLMQIMEKGKEIGQELSMNAQLALQKNLLEAMEKGGVENAIQYCSVNAMDIVKEVEEKYDASVRRVSTLYRNPANQPDSIENLILEAYSYSFDNSMPLEDAIQDEDEKYVLFTKPILLGSPLCMNCHGEVGKQIKEKDYDEILALYPEDKAVNYSPGQFRGMWSIRIAKKEIVKVL